MVFPGSEIKRFGSLGKLIFFRLIYLSRVSDSDPLFLGLAVRHCKAVHSFQASFSFSSFFVLYQQSFLK